jgi:hypothetical protein
MLSAFAEARQLRILPVYCRLISVRLLGSGLFGRKSRKSIASRDYRRFTRLDPKTEYTIRIPVRMGSVVAPKLG